MHSTTPPTGGELARLARENRRLRRQTERAKVQLVRQRGLGRLGPEALAAALDELRVEGGRQSSVVGGEAVDWGMRRGV